MIKAVIDLGTNTFNLLIAKIENNQFIPIYNTKIGVALGMGGINQQLITEDAIQRAIETITLFKQTCTDFQVNEIIAIGTSALRDASNRKEFCQIIQEQLDIKIIIISGEEEAQYIYQGVKISYDFTKKATIMDIGGGSTEFILADKNGIIKSISLNIGVSRIYQQLKLSNPLTKEDVKSIQNWLDQHTENQLEEFCCELLVGSSGTFETLYEIYYKKAFSSTSSCLSMTIENLYTVLDWIINSTLEDRQQNPFIIPIRQKMLPITAVKIKWIINKLNIKKLVISPYSLKEGVIL